MVHTVGFTGANGAVGIPTAKLLAEYAVQGKINLVILHRAGSPPKNLEDLKNVELRTVNLSQPGPELDEAVKGISVMITAIGAAGIEYEPNLVEALSKSPDIVTYIPSSYSMNWSQRDKEDDLLGPTLRYFHGAWDKAVEKNIGVTAVYTGILDNYFFAYGWVGGPIKDNTFHANKSQMKNKVPITTTSHLAQGLAHLAISDPESIKNTRHTAVTFWPTGQEVADMYSKINGQPATVKDFTEKDREETRANAETFGPGQVGYRDHWEKDDWDYPSSNLPYNGPSIEDVARSYA